MPAAISIRLGLIAPGLVALAGCGQSAPRPVAAAHFEAPRQIELPPGIRPLTIDRAPLALQPADDSGADARPIPAQYEQPRQDNPRPSCLVDLSTTPKPAASEPVREPISAPPAQAPAGSPAPPARSTFTPISLPQPATAPAAAPAPTLTRSPVFIPASRSMSGPQFVPPTREATAQMPRVAVSLPTLDSPPQAPDSRLLPPASLEPIAQRAMQMADQASAVAQRGMFYSAQTDLLQALQLLSQAQDVQEGCTRHAAALAAGLTALEEAREFAAVNHRPSESIDVASIAASHRTPLLKNAAGPPLSPIIAQQQYFAFAEQQFAIAAGGIAASSQVLYRLGRLQTALSAHDADPLALHGPQAIVFHQAALATDGGNWLAANELGVLYARYGQLAQARQILLYSLRIHPHLQGWQNLATVHRRLGETDLAKLADNERQLLAQKSAPAAENSGDMVRWVDPKTFAAAGGHDAQAPDTRYAAAGASASAPRR